MPLWHCMKPQQSAELVHSSPAPTQQRGTSGAGRHTDPLQHSLPGKRPPSTQLKLGPRQVLQSPNWQLSAPSQLPPVPPVSQHICMSRPQPSGVISQVGVGPE